MNKKSKSERLTIVMDIVKRLKQFPKSHIGINDDFPFINLYNMEYETIRKLHDVFQSYINQDDNNPKQLIGFSGNLEFVEIDRRIEYILPIRSYAQPLFVLKVIK